MIATKLSTDLGIKSKLIEGRRVTDGETLKIVTMVYSGLINKNIIARISLDRANYRFGYYLPANKLNGLLLSDVRGYSGKIDLNKINLQIVSDIGTPLPLNGYDFSLCLEIEHD